MRFQIDHGALVARHNGETLRIEAWGKDSLRVRATRLSQIQDENWALTEAVPESGAEVTIADKAPEGCMDVRADSKSYGIIRNGRIVQVQNKS